MTDPTPPAADAQPGVPIADYPAPGPVTANPVPMVFRATATRRLTIPVAAIQPVLVRAALVAGFTLQDQLLTSIRGQRGSKYSGAALKPDKLPVSLAISLTDTPAGAQVELVLTDRWPGVFGRSPAVAAAFRPVLLALIADMDSALVAADPRAEFPEPECTIPAELVGARPTAIGRTIDRTNRALEATPGARGRATPTGSVMLVLPDAYAELDWTELQAMMTAGVLIATRRGPLPERLAGEVARVVAALETAAPRAGASSGEVRIDLDAAARPVIDFLDLQAQLRSRLPLRTLHVCTTCRLEKIVNPDFQRLQAKNRKLRILTTTVGGAISMHGVSAFLLVGRLAHLKLLDPDFVCPRCQGMTAETSLITFCPQCGERSDDAALRTCRKCQHDLRTEATITPLWTEGAPPAVWTAPAPYVAVGGDPSTWPAPDPEAAYPAPAVDAGNAWPAPDAATAWPVPEPAPELPTEPTLANLPPPQPAMRVGPPPGWHPDPHGRHQFRWWDGAAWSEHVSNHGIVTSDPIGMP